MIHNEDMLGVVREIDENNNRYLLVDFGDEAEVKIDIDELIISGQKRWNTCIYENRNIYLHHT